MAGKATVGYIISVYDKFTRPLDSFNRKLTKLDKNLFRSSSKMSGLSIASGVFGTAAKWGISGLVALGTSAVLTADRFKNLKLGLEVATGSTAEANKMFEQLIKLSERTPTSLKALTHSAVEMQNLGFSAKETIEEVKRLNKIHLATTESLDRITNAMTRMWIAGKITNFQFRSLGKAYAPMMKALTKVMERFGYSADQTKVLLNQGRIGLGALTLAEKEYTKETGITSKVTKEYAETLGGSFTRLMNILSVYSVATYKATFGTATIGKEISKLDSFLQKAIPSYTKFTNILAKEVKLRLLPALEQISPSFGVLKDFIGLLNYSGIETKHKNLQLHENIKSNVLSPNLKPNEPGALKKHEITVNVNTQTGTTANVETKSGSPTVSFKVGKNMAHILGRK